MRGEKAVTTYEIERDVEEWITVEAASEEEARDTANETPIDEWEREVHDERMWESTGRAVGR
jgi:hypothetical protein